jgi:hypothetical protein
MSVAETVRFSLFQFHFWSLPYFLLTFLLTSAIFYFTFSLWNLNIHLYLVKRFPMFFVLIIRYLGISFPLFCIWLLHSFLSSVHVSLLHLIL